MRHPEALLTTRQAADLAGVTQRTIANWVRRGLVRGYRDRASRRFFVIAEDAASMAPDRRLVRVTGRSRE